MAMSFKTVVLLHPGNMGVTIGAAAATSGARVVWVSEQRGEATRRRAEEAGLTDVKRLNNALGESELVLSVCPPHALTRARFSTTSPSPGESRSSRRYESCARS